MRCAECGDLSGPFCSLWVETACEFWEPVTVCVRCADASISWDEGDDTQGGDGHLLD